MEDNGIAPPALDYAFTVKIDFKERVLFQTAAGRRGYTPPAGGEVWGPHLQGSVWPYSGADYHGVYGLDAHYMLKASDGSPIYVHNTGYFYRTDADVITLGDAQYREGHPYYFRVTPKFDAPLGPHEWLARTVFVGTGEAHPDFTIFNYFAVR